jgi:hypothetical protein
MGFVISKQEVSSCPLMQNFGKFTVWKGREERIKTEFHFVISRNAL